MALIDPKTGLPISSRKQNQESVVTLMEILDGLPPFPIDVVKGLATKAVSALIEGKTHMLARGASEDEALRAVVGSPVTVELGVFAGLLRDLIFLRALLRMDTEGGRDSAGVTPETKLNNEDKE